MRGPSPLLHTLADIARDAGTIVMRHYAGPAIAEEKADRSPVTAADREADALIRSALQSALPGLPIISEESFEDAHPPPTAPRFALVDPLDGTKEFLKRNGEFTVNIAVIEDGRSVAGVVYAPASGTLYAGAAGAGAWAAHCPCAPAAPGQALRDARSIAARPAPAEGLVALVSRSHADTRTEEYLAHYRIAGFRSAGSSLKFCLIAAGEADMYPRHGTTMEWDTAAGQAVLEAAGGRVLCLDGTPLAYGKAGDGWRNPFFVAWGAPG